MTNFPSWKTIMRCIVDLLTTSDRRSRPLRRQTAGSSQQRCQGQHLTEETVLSRGWWAKGSRGSTHRWLKSCSAYRGRQRGGGCRGSGRGSRSSASTGKHWSHEGRSLPGRLLSALGEPPRSWMCVQDAQGRSQAQVAGAAAPSHKTSYGIRHQE